MASGARNLPGHTDAIPGTAATGTAGTPRRRGKPIALALADYEAAARRHLPRPIFGYIAGAAETAAALGGTIPVMIDSGFRRGTDVLKALALGAAFVFVGRPFLYAASVGGRPEIERAVAILKDEVVRNMGLLGVNALSELGPDRLNRIPVALNS